MDCEFANAFLGSRENREGLAKFLKGLDTLDLGVRRGLLKTLLHAVLLTVTARKAHRLSHPHRSALQPCPMDAIVAHTTQCNLCCQGCYTLNELDGAAVNPFQLDYVVSQLKQLDVFHVLLVGKGEPFHDEQSKQSLFEVVRRHPQVFFSVYSNGTNILEDDVLRLRTVPNLIPVLSIDGSEDVNDWRRGPGVHQKVTDAFERMRRRRLLFGYISTVFNQNYEAVLAPAFVGRMASLGCRVGFYSLFVTPDHTPCDNMMLSVGKREEYAARFRQLQAKADISLIDIDAVEAGFGCRAKRGATVYIDAVTGQVAPCVRATFSPESCNLFQPAHPDRLAEILESEFFRDYRQQSPSLPCDALRRVEEPDGLSF